MKLVKEHINEKFVQDSDPIHDLGIGDPAFWILDKKPKHDKYDDSGFFLTLHDGTKVEAMGDEFDPSAFDMTLEEMLKFIDKGIKKILKIPKKNISVKELGVYTDFFESEIWDEDLKFFSKEYVIGKLICGKENAKWKMI